MKKNKNNNVTWDDTDPEGVPLQDSRKLTIRGFLKDIISLTILVTVLYSLYFISYTYLDYQKMKDNISNAALLASKSSDDNAIKKYLSSYCVISQNYYCTTKDIEIERDFENATINMKFKYRFIVFNKWPIITTFNPKVKVPIE